MPASVTTVGGEVTFSIGINIFKNIVLLKSDTCTLPVTMNRSNSFFNQYYVTKVEEGL